jgi:hypothetical protein
VFVLGIYAERPPGIRRDARHRGTAGERDREDVEFEAETGISIGNDVASSRHRLTIAVERPSLPVPGWVYEVLRQFAIPWLVEVFNRKSIRAGAPSQAGQKLTLTQEINGRPWNVLRPATGTLALY